MRMPRRPRTRSMPASWWSPPPGMRGRFRTSWAIRARVRKRSEEHTSELQSRLHLVCRLLLEKKKIALNDAELLESFSNSLRLSFVLRHTIPHHPLLTFTSDSHYHDPAVLDQRINRNLEDAP